MLVDGRSMLSTNGLKIISTSTGGFWHIDISGASEKKGNFHFWCLEVQWELSVREVTSRKNLR